MPVTPNSIITPQGVRSASAVCTGANTNYSDTPSPVVELFTAGPNGSRITSVRAMPRATVTATQLQLFRDGNGSGTAKRLCGSRLMAAHSVANNTAIPETDFGFSESAPLVLAPDEKLYCGAAVALAGGIVFNAEAQDY